jgi:hypothetical protein
MTFLTLFLIKNLIIVIFLSFTLDSSSEIPFKHVVIDASPNTGTLCCTDVCALGDINRDGFNDIIIGAENAHQIGLVWYEFPTWIKHPIGSGQFTTDCQIYDIDGDNFLDVIISDNNIPNDGIYWYKNPNDLSVSSWVPCKIGSGYAHDLEVGDIDGDGDIDVVTCDKEKLLLWQQKNPTSWIKRTVLSKEGEGTALADIDLDGDLDIVYGGIWLENQSDIKYWVQHTIDSTWSPMSRVTVVDLNKDGKPDLKPLKIPELEPGENTS